MGREIVYCWKCATRLDGADFEKRAAFRYGDKVSCAECVYDLVADLPAEEQEAVLSGQPPPSTTRIKSVRTGGTGAVPRSTGAVPTTRQTKAVPRADGGTSRRGTGTVPKASTGPIAAGTRGIKRATGAVPKAPSPEELDGEEVAEDPAARKKKVLLIAAGGGGFLVVAVVLAVVLLSGGKAETPAEDPAAPSRRAAAPPPVDPKIAKEEAAKRAFEDAMAFFKSEPENLGGQMKGLRAALEVGKDTATSEQILRQIEILGLRVKEKVEALQDECTPHFQGEKFKALFDLLGEKKALHDIPEWQDAVEKKIEGYRGIAEDRFKNVVRGAREAQEQGGGDGKVKDFLARLEKWEMAEYVEKFQKELGVAPEAASATAPDASKPSKTPAKPVRKPPSPEMQRYLPAFERALGAAFGRDYDQAVLEIRRSARDIESDEVKKESDADLQALESVKAFVEGTIKLLPNKGRGQRMTLEYFDAPTAFKEVSGRVMSVNDQRFEVKSDGQEGKEGPTVFVEFLALTGKSLVELNKARKGKLDPLAAAQLHLLEGNEEAAKAVGGQAANRIADRWWDWAPQAKDKAPKSNSKEFEARRAFHAAELDWRDVKTWGAAFEKYRMLTNDYATTAISRNNQAYILRRTSVGKEYMFYSVGEGVALRGNFNFKLQKGDDMHWLSTAEAEGRDILENYVEAEFYALPGLTYRSWAYVGACCEETFTFYYQASEQKTRNEGKEIQIDPGSLALAKVPTQLSGLKKTHELHKPKDPKAPHPMTPARWEWIPVPLPKTFAGAGAKAIRLCTTHPGLGIRYIVVSSSRTRTPNEQETAEFAKEALAARDEAEAAAPKIAGTPEPADWVVVGPFDTGINRILPPEQGIDIDQEMQSKDKKKIKWKRVKAELRDAGGGKAAVLDLAPQFAPKDNVNGYALIHVKAPAAMDAKLLLGFDDGIKVWVNESIAFSKDSGGGLTPDKETASIKLEDGWNRILVKVRNGTGGYGFAFRIADANKKPIPGLEYNPYGDQLVGP